MEQLGAPDEAAAIRNWLSAFSAGDPRVEALLAISLGRVLASAARRGEDWTSSVTCRDGTAFASWLRAELAAKAPWLDRRDERGRPLKLMKLGSVDQAMREVGKARGRLPAPAAPLGPGEERHADLGDGWSLVRLRAQGALDREGEAVQHCLESQTYGAHLSSPGHLVLSLRDPRNGPHATVEVANGMLVQLQGKQNKPPVRRHMERILPFVRASGWLNTLRPSWTGHVVDADGRWHPLDALPAGLAVGGDLDLADTDVETLPENLAVLGWLRLEGSKVRALPKGLVAYGGSRRTGRPCESCRRASCAAEPWS